MKTTAILSLLGLFCSLGTTLGSPYNHAQEQEERVRYDYPQEQEECLPWYDHQQEQEERLPYHYPQQDKTAETQATDRKL